MKTLFDNFVSCIIFIVMIFAFASFSTTEMQILSARHIHTSAINQIQASYYTADIDAINEKIKESYPDGSWYIESMVINSVNSRQDRLVTLHYKVVMPLFGISQTGTIEGYAR